MVRYTGKVVTIRFGAFMLALLVAVSPLIGVVCALDCDLPSAASPLCHVAAVSDDGVAWQVSPHSCGHEHMNASPGLLSSASSRNMAESSVAAPSLTPVFVILPAVDVIAASVLHGPPGVTPRSRSLPITVLRV